MKSKAFLALLIGVLGTGVLVLAVGAQPAAVVETAAYTHEYEHHEQADQSLKPWQLTGHGWDHYVTPQNKDYVAYIAAGKKPKLVPYVPPTPQELARRRRAILRGWLERTDCLVTVDEWAGLDAAQKNAVAAFRAGIRGCFGSATPLPDPAGVVAVLQSTKREE